jgi:hypothetical protein
MNEVPYLKRKPWGIEEFDEFFDSFRDKCGRLPEWLTDDICLKHSLNGSTKYEIIYFGTTSYGSFPLKISSGFYHMEDLIKLVRTNWETHKCMLFMNALISIRNDILAQKYIRTISFIKDIVKSIS